MRDYVEMGYGLLHVGRWTLDVDTLRLVQLRCISEKKDDRNFP